jgi:hypothetical protein
MSESEDAARYRWIIENCVSMAEACREGPEHPELYLYADLWNKQPTLSPKVRIEQEIDRQRAIPKFEWRRPQ